MKLPLVARDALVSIKSGILETKYRFREERRLRGESPAFEEAWESVGGVFGWLYRNEAEALFELVRSAPPGSDIVEIGSYLGRSTIILAKAARSNSSRVFSVDPHTGADTPAQVDTYGSFLHNVEKAGVADIVTAIRATSVEGAASWTAGQTIGFLFIDGEHSERAVIEDFTSWSAFLMPRAYVAFDDYFDANVQAGIQQLIKDNLLGEYLGARGKIGAFGPKELLDQRARTLLRQGASPEPPRL